MSQVRIFLSCVSAEFRSYREALRHDLDRPNVTVKVQEDFIATGSETLDKLDDYIRRCDVVIHWVGDMTGASAKAPSIDLIRKRYSDMAERLPPLEPFLKPDSPALSYTQWEAWLALYQRKTLLIVVPEADAQRDEGYQLIESQCSQQQQHLARLAGFERYPEIRFNNSDQLVKELWRSSLLDILAKAGAKQIVHLPLASIGEQFKGRDDWLITLADKLGPDSGNSRAPKTLALIGLGGIGKTRLALEYAWRHGSNYSAMLFAVADSPETLQRNLASLCRQEVLDLPEQQDSDEGKQYAAVLNWLKTNHGWLLILDNADSEAAAAAVEELTPQLNGGHVLITSRLSNWSSAIEALPVDLLSPDASVEFLLSRTEIRRRKLDDDREQAEILAEELGYLALALEQAGAFIAQRRMSFSVYLQEWRSHREQVLAWYDPRLMQYPNSVAITWQTSFSQLSEPAVCLLQRLAWFSPAPIPESILGTRLEEDGDLYAALAELEAYSLVERDDTPFFTVHRLVQDVTRRQVDAQAQISLQEALQWIDAAFTGDPGDVRSWPVLEPLMPHAQAVLDQAETAGMISNTWLMNQLAGIYLTKFLYAEAEPLIRRALAIDEASFGLEHPKVALCLNNLAQLLKATNRLSEAEPLMRRALAIDEACFGEEHPDVARDLNNLAQLLQATNRLSEAEPLMRRALAIDEASFGAEHPNVARNLNNLAALLQTTNRLLEAEPLIQRALAIDEASFGSEHPNVALGLNNLAVLLRGTNRLSEAEPLMRRALAIDEASFGEEHPKVAIRLNNLAQLLQDTNRLSEAEPLMRRALAIEEASFGAEHPNVARDLNNLAQLLQATNRSPEAEPLMRRALKIFIESLGLEHPNTRGVALAYIELLKHSGLDKDEVKKLIQDIVYR